MDSLHNSFAVVSKAELNGAVKSTKMIASKVDGLIGEIKEEFSELEVLKAEAGSWRKLQRMLECEDCILVSRMDIERLTTEAMQIKEYLPKVLKKDFYTAYAKLDKTESDLSQIKAEKQKISGELDRARKKQQNLMGELEGERQERAEMRNIIDELTEINSQQSAYCSRMGAASCTLLWRLSQREDCTETILAGTHTDEFIQLMCHTIESFSLTLSENDSYEEDSKEVKFVLALCGVATNIAASPFGREFLMSNDNGQKLVNSILFTSSKLSPHRKQEMKIRNLCLKFLYNISINQRGIKHLTKKVPLVQMLVSLIEDASMENRVLSVRLVQSLMLESENAVLCQTVTEMLPVEKMRAFAVNANGELQEALLELINDVKCFSREQ